MELFFDYTALHRFPLAGEWNVFYVMYIAACVCVGGCMLAHVTFSGVRVKPPYE